MGAENADDFRLSLTLLLAMLRPSLAAATTLPGLHEKVKDARRSSNSSSSNC